MTMTRRQLEAVIERQLVAMAAWQSGSYQASLEASQRAILDAVDDWAASQVAAAVTPPATIDGPKVMARIRERLARALDTTTGGDS